MYLQRIYLSWDRILDNLKVGEAVLKGHFMINSNKTEKQLYIYIERKFYTTDDSLITGIKAILAEDYSRELSKKINNAHRNRQKSGGTVMINSNVYGFRKLPDKSIALIEEEAEVKRRMYQLCASGFGTRTIATILENGGIRKRTGKPFGANDILRMIKNPINKGCVVMGRLHYDFETKKTIKTDEEELLKEKPDSTAVSIAETLGFTLSATHYRMNVLKKEGRIKYHREGQSGYWEVKKADTRLL